MLRFGKKSVFWKWIISYISVILIMVFCNFLTYSRSWEMMKEHQSQMNQLVLQQISERVYDNALQLEKIRERILANGHYAFLCRASERQYKSLAYRRYALCADIRNYQAMSGRFSKILVHFEDGDYIVSSDNVNSARLYWTVYQGELGVTQEEWAELMEGEYPALHMKKIVDEDGRQGLIYARTLQSSQTGYQRINVFFLYTADDLERMLVNHQSEDVFSVAVKGNNDEVVLMDVGGLLDSEEDWVSVEDAVRQGFHAVSLADGEEIMLNYGDGAFTEGICMIFSQNIYMESIQRSQQIYMITFAVTILFSIVLIILYAKRNYKPLQELIDVIGPEDWASVQYKNEFALVQDRLSKVQNENKNVNMTLRRQNKLFRSEYFAKLLTGNKVSLPEDQMEEFYDIRFISDLFAVMLFYVESYEEEREEGLDLDKAQFILGNVFHELLEEYSCMVYQTRISDLMVLIVNLPRDTVDDKEILCQTAARGNEFINQYFNMEYSCSISNTHEGKKELAAAYQEALQAMESKRLYGLDDMLFYGDIIELSGTGYYYPMEQEQELMRQIQASNYEAARAVYESVVEENMNGRMIASQDTLRCLMYDLLGTVLKTLNERKEDEKFARDLKPAKRMAACQGLPQMMETFDDILQKTCEYLEVKSGAEDKETLCLQIQDYIRKNYCDPNLSVTSIAEHFSLPPVMMSKMFREIVGEKIPVVVSEVRLEAAKKLMCQSEVSLGEIAERAGFGSVRTFTRIFKQMENCTPGQWRESNS